VRIDFNGNKLLQYMSEHKHMQALFHFHFPLLIQNNLLIIIIATSAILNHYWCSNLYFTHSNKYHTIFLFSNTCTF